MTQYYDDTAKDYAERAEAAAESASQSKQQASTAATTATTQANIATNAAQNAAVLVRSELENDVRAMKDAALSAASQASANAAAASASAVDASHDAIDADQARQAAQAAVTDAVAAKTAAESAQSAASGSATQAASSEAAALASQQAAASSQADALASKNAAAASQADALASKNAAKGSEDAAAASATLSQSWAKGDTGVRDGEDTNNAKYWAEQSRQYSPENKANKPSPLPEEDGHLAEVDTDGNLVTSDLKSEEVAKRDGYYGQDGLGAHTAEQLIDPNAPGTDRKFGFDTACGDITISDNGNAMPEKLMGTTHVTNQLVHDTNMNTKSSTDGKLALTDAVGGSLSKLEIHGGCVVHNQLVKESIAKTVSGTGRLGVEDGVAGNAESFVMTAPRSVVMNQLVQNGNFADSFSSWTSLNVSTSVANNVCTVSYNTEAQYKRITQNVALIAGHVYARYCEFISSGLLEEYVMFGGNGFSSVKADASATTSWKSYFSKDTSSHTNTVNLHFSLCNETINTAYSTQIRNIQLIDLTQYFNGNTTLINSITSWDDLVAYDPSFASYVPYSIGTVKGVTPSVKVNHATDVACPVELFGIGDTTGDSFDGASGVVTRKVGAIDMGTMDWVYQSGSGQLWSTSIESVIQLAGDWGLNIICSPYIASAALQGNKSIANALGTIKIKDTSYTDAVSFKAAMSGVMLYYELAEPTTSQYTPTTIPTVDIYNSAVQTSNERLASLSMTYQGRDQTIALDPTHTYVFNDNQVEDSVITGQSTLDVVGGEDMLVDLTQLYNGDSTKISQIQRWASLSTRFHRYRDLMPYNPGTVEPDTPVVRNYLNEHAYGVIYDPSQSSTTLRWVELNNGVITEKASFAEFSSTPCHEIWRCVMDDLANRHVNYYLDDADSNKKYNGTRLGVTSDGTASVLTGADGDVMSRFPIGYWDLDEDYNGEGKMLWLVSDSPFMGMHCPAEPHEFFYVSPDGATLREQFVGSFKGVLCDADGNPLNTTEGALAQVTGTSGTNKVRSIAGALPYVSVTLNDFTARAVRNGSTSVNTKFTQWLSLLMFVEYGTLNTQSISQGYSNGIQNAFCFWRKSGRVNAGNGTAEIFADAGSQDMDNFQSFKVGSTTVQRDTLMDADGRYAWSVYNRNASSTRYFTDNSTPANGDTVYAASTGDTAAGTVASYSIKAEASRVIQWQYRGIENPFGETWTFEHGIQVYNDAALLSIKVNNVVYTREPSMDGAASRAYVNTGTYMWIGLTLPSNAHAFLDAGLTQDSGYVATANAYLKYNNGYWETLATADYTMTAQQTAANPVYTWKDFPWALGNGYIKKFDPMTFMAKTVGGSASTYLPDYYYTTTNGSCVVYVGGNANNGLNDGLAYRYVALGLAPATVYISGRLSA